MVSQTSSPGGGPWTGASSPGLCTGTCVPRGRLNPGILSPCCQSDPNGSFSGNDAVGDILEKLPSRAIGSESCNMKQPIRSRTKLKPSNQRRSDEQTVEGDGSKQIELCLETPCEEDADDGCIPLDGSTNSRCEKLTGRKRHREEKKPEPEASHITREHKEPEASHSGVACSGKTWIEKQLSPIRGDYSRKKVKRVSVGAWASNFDRLPTVFTSLKCALPDGIEKALWDLYKNIKKLGTKGKELGLLIVILPDTSDYNKKVEEVCYELGVACHCLLPCDIMQRQHLRVAREIYSKVSDGKDKDGDSTEMDEIYNFDEMSSDGDSSEISNLPNFVEMKEERSIEMYWACVSFPYMDGRRLLRFLCKLRTKLAAIGMDFSAAPIKIDKVSPADIRNSLFSARDSVSELFTKLGMKGQQIRLLLVIMPEDTGCHAEVDEVCKSLGVVYQCCLPNDVWMRSKQYVEKTAQQIKLKVSRPPASLM